MRCCVVTHDAVTYGTHDVVHARSGQLLTCHAMTWSESDDETTEVPGDEDAASPRLSIFSNETSFMNFKLQS